MDTLRKIQSSSSEHAPGEPRSDSRRASVESTEDSALSTGSLSPTSQVVFRKRDSRPSHSSFGKTKSAVSLGSIAEEPKMASERGPKENSSASKPRGAVFEGPDSPPSDEDGVMMRGSKVIPEESSGRDPCTSEHQNEQWTDFETRECCPSIQNITSDGLSWSEARVANNKDTPPPTNIDPNHKSPHGAKQTRESCHGTKPNPPAHSERGRMFASEKTT